MEKIFTDQMNRTISIDFPPKRIISLVPSQTELLFYLGLEKEVIGMTKFCIHPKKQFKVKTKIGGTKQFHFDRILTLKPHLIIGNKEENDKEQIENLAKLYPVWMSDIKNLEDALEMILQIGDLVDRKTKAKKLVEEIQKGIQQLPPISKPKSVAYFIWRKPYLVASADTFISEMLELAGFVNAFKHKSRYPEISLWNQDTEISELANAKPDIIFLSSEPYPFKEQHFDIFKRYCPTASIQLVDGELFSWYGNRLLFAIPYFLKLRSKYY